MVAIHDQRDINIDDIAFFKYLLGIRDAMTNDFINTGADGLGKAVVTKGALFAP